MRIRLSVLLVVASLATASVWAQETRGNINGTVQDSSGVIPGATITVTNVDTGQTQRLVTNNSSYLEAPLLQLCLLTDPPSHVGVADDDERPRLLVRARRCRRRRADSVLDQREVHRLVREHADRSSAAHPLEEGLNARALGLGSHPPDAERHRTVVVVH